MDATSYNGRSGEMSAARDNRNRRGARKRAQIVCMAVIAPNNALMYIRVFNAPADKTDETNWMQMQEVVYNSLDVVEERIWSANTRSASPVRETDGFLGCLAVVGRTCVFGSVTKSLHKALIVMRDGHDVSDATVRTSLTRVIEAMALALMNCLVAPNHEALRSRRFDTRMVSIAHEFNASNS